MQNLWSIRQTIEKKYPYGEQRKNDGKKILVGRMETIVMLTEGY